MVLNQKGIAPLIIIAMVAVILALGGVVYYFSQPKTESIATNSPEPTSFPTLEPINSPITTSTPKASSKSVTKSALKPTPTVSPTTTPIPTAIPGQYHVVSSYGDTSVTVSLKTKNTYAEGGRALIQDSTGAIVKDQTDFEFNWSIDDPSLVHFSYFSPTGDYGCVFDIKSPCPKFDFVVNPLDRTGNTKVRVKVVQKSQNKIIGEVTYDITVTE